MPTHGPPGAVPHSDDPKTEGASLEHISAILEKGPTVQGMTVEQRLTGYPKSTIIEVNNATQYLMMNPGVEVNRG